VISPVIPSEVEESRATTQVVLMRHQNYRAKKEALIARRNPEWRDLFSEMYAVRSIKASR